MACCGRTSSNAVTRRVVASFIDPDRIKKSDLRGPVRLVSQDGLCQDLFRSTLKPVKKVLCDSKIDKFEVDANGILNVSATDKTTGGSSSLTVSTTSEGSILLRIPRKVDY